MPGTCAVSVAGICATTAHVNAPVITNTAPIRMAGPVIVVVLSEPCVVCGMGRILEQARAARQRFLTDGPVEMPNRTEGPTNAAEFAVGCGWRASTREPRAGKCAPLVLATGRFVIKLARVVEFHGRMSA
jgi:hypothetical protein